MSSKDRGTVLKSVTAKIKFKISILEQFIIAGARNDRLGLLDRNLIECKQLTEDAIVCREDYQQPELDSRPYCPSWSSPYLRKLSNCPYLGKWTHRAASIPQNRNEACEKLSDNEN